MKVRVIHGLILIIGALTANIIIVGCQDSDNESDFPPTATTTIAPTPIESTSDVKLYDFKKNNDPYSDMSCNEILDLYAKEVNDYVKSKRKNKIDFDKTSSKLLQCDLQNQIDSMDIEMNVILAKKGGVPTPRD